MRESEKRIKRKIGVLVVLGMFVFGLCVPFALAVNQDKNESATGSYKIDIDSDSDSDTQNFIVSHDNGTELFRIQEDGKVGIGTYNPMSTLSVAGGVTVGTTWASAWPAPSGGMIVQGKVGIGKTNPLYTLHIKELAPSTETILALETESYDISPGDHLGTIMFTGPHPDGTGAMIRAEASGPFSPMNPYISPTGLQFYTQDYTSYNGLLNPRMVITAEGNVGIGTTTPFAKVHITQDGLADAFRVDDQASDITPFVIDQFGNVGIGTADPTSALHVIGDASITGSLNLGLGTLYIDDTNNRVGINTTNPQYALEVHGDEAWFNVSVLTIGNDPIMEAGYKDSSISATHYRIIFDENIDAADYFFAVGAYEDHEAKTPPYETKELFWIRENGSTGVGAKYVLGRFWVHSEPYVGGGNISTSGTTVTGTGTSFTTDMMIGSEIWVDISNEIKNPKDDQRQIRRVTAINSDTSLVIHAAFDPDLPSGTDYNYTVPIFSVTTDEKVGISTISPTEKLDVNGKARIRVLPTGGALDNVVVADSNGVLHIRDESTIGIQNLWETIDVPSGTDLVANIPTDTLILAKDGIVTIEGNSGTDTITIGATEVDGSTTNELQNLWFTMTGDSGSTSADSLTDTFNIVGTGMASTSISDDTLTVHVDPSGAADADWYEVGTTSPPDDITDNIYTHGNVGIGAPIPGAKLDVEVSSGGAATIGSSLCSAIGNYAVAMGYRSTASGTGSMARGYYATASGLYSTASGGYVTASGFESTAMGWRATAGDYSTAIGFEVTASSGSTAMGHNTTASGRYSTAMGGWITVAGNHSYGIGLHYIPGWTITQDHTMAIMGGKVGIGTVSPTEKLEVDGKIRANTCFNHAGTDGITQVVTFEDNNGGTHTLTFNGGILTGYTGP